MLLTAAVIFSGFVNAQIRPLEANKSDSVSKSVSLELIAAKYEGGMYGFSSKESGALKFDDINERLVFFGKENKEKFSIPYKSMLVIYPESKSVRSTTGTVVSVIPLPGAGLAGLIHEKRRYLVINFEDPDVDVKGTVNFKLNNKEVLKSSLNLLAVKAGLSQRGDAYYRPKN